MKIAFFIKKKNLEGDESIAGALSYLREHECSVYDLLQDGLQEGTSLILCFGGDGTILSVAPLASAKGIPVLGINMGRMGFLSDNKMEDVLRLALSGEFATESRRMLQCTVKAQDGTVRGSFTALNDVCVRRSSAGMLGTEVTLDGSPLPTYWADGVILCTSTGSTAYSLSVGGPICAPSSDVFVLSPIAPHNLNMRPLVIPAVSFLTFRVHNSEKVGAVVSVDNHEYPLRGGDAVEVGAAPKPLILALTQKSNFTDALQSKLFWGEDIRNLK